MKRPSISRKNILFPSLSFFIPLVIMAGILAGKGIWLGSSTTILASDGFHQYVIFNQTLRNVLHGEGSLLYTFTSGLGLNFYALSSYYLGSFLSPFSYFFDLKNMPDFMYLSTLIKFGLIGLSSYLSLTGIHRTLRKEWALLLSNSFALMSFATSQLEINSWLDVFILVPLILLGLHKLSIGQGRMLYFISLTCLFIQNYYFGYMTAIALIWFFLLNLSWNVKKKWRYGIDFTIVSLLAGLSSMIMLLPTYLDLKTHGETFTKIVNLQTDKSWYFDIFAKSLVGSYDTTKFGAIPMIFIGLLPLIFALVFFTLQSVKWTVKAAHASFFIFLIASFYLQPLDLFWQGMHAPNMFLHRYAWVFSVLIVYMAAESLKRLDELTTVSFSIPFVLLIVGFIATYWFRTKYPYLNTIQFILTAEFLLAYLILFLGQKYQRMPLKVFILISLVFSLFEISIHTYYQVEGLSAEWHFPSRDSYMYQLKDIQSLVSETRKNNINFYRTERLLPQTGNDSMKYSYNGISQFSSIRNRSSSFTLDKLGFRSDGTNLNLRYQNNTLIGDSLLGIRYNLAVSDPLKFGFTQEKTGKELQLYRNDYASGLAILSHDIYKDVKFTNLTLDNQTNYLNQITGFNLQYYNRLQVTHTENAEQIGNRITVNKTDNQNEASVNYTLFVPANTQVYVSLPKLQFSNDSSKDVHITVNNVSNRFTIDNAFAFFNVGHFSEVQEVKVTIFFPQNNQVSFDTPQFYGLDLNAYQLAMDQIHQQEIRSTVKGNQVTTTYTAQNDQSILLTIPYDKGWTASLNGKKIPIKRLQKGFMKVDVPKGKGKLTLTFIPQGFYIGLSCFFIGITLFIAYEYFLRNHNHPSNGWFEQGL